MTPAEPAAFDPGGHWLAGISRDDPPTPPGPGPRLALAFSPDGAHLAAAGAGRRTVLLWDLAAERPAVTHQGPELAMDLAFSPDGRRVAVASRRMIKLLDAASGEEVLILRGF